jgi:hypothetical protein
MAARVLNAAAAFNEMQLGSREFCGVPVQPTTRSERSVARGSADALSDLAQ